MANLVNKVDAAWVKQMDAAAKKGKISVPQLIDLLSGKEVYFSGRSVRGYGLMGNIETKRYHEGSPDAAIIVNCKIASAVVKMCAWDANDKTIEISKREVPQYAYDIGNRESAYNPCIHIFADVPG